MWPKEEMHTWCLQLLRQECYSYSSASPALAELPTQCNGEHSYQCTTMREAMSIEVEAWRS